MSSRKEEVITFKVDKELAERIKGVANRSEFIRNAVLAAMDNACPLCNGTGVLSIEQRSYWNEFTRTHRMEPIPEAHGVRLVCDAGKSKK